MAPPGKKKRKTGSELNRSATGDAVTEKPINMDAPCDTGIAEAEIVKRILLTLEEEAARLETQARTGMEAALIAAEKALVRATEATHVADAESAGATQLAAEQDNENAETDIYELVARNMHTPVVQRDGEWTRPDNLPIDIMSETILLRQMTGVPRP